MFARSYPLLSCVLGELAEESQVIAMEVGHFLIRCSVINFSSQPLAMHIPRKLNNTTKQCCYVSRWATVQLVIENAIAPRANPPNKHQTCGLGAALDCVSDTAAALSII